MKIKPSQDSRKSHLKRANDSQQSSLIQNLPDANIGQDHNIDKSGWIDEKQVRYRALLNSFLYILETEGSIFLCKHIYRFLTGERKNTQVIPVETLNFISKATEPQRREKDLYYKWILETEPSNTALRMQQNQDPKFVYRPLISIITPVFNTEETVLEKMIFSVLAQTYSNWELCIVDGHSEKEYIRLLLDKYAWNDDRIKIKYLDHNLGISENSNQAIEMANGEFIALLDHDDKLAPNALYEYVLLLNSHPDADIIYSDEDKIDLREIRSNPFFKPDWSPDLFRSIMYTCHLGVYRTSLVKSVGNFRIGFDGSQDHDLVLRLIEKTSRIYHIPKILYHWRMVPGSTSLNNQAKDYAEAARIKAVQEHCERTGFKGTAEPGLFNGAVRFKYLPDHRPLVSIIIPTRDKSEILRKCIESILELSSYQNYEILIVDNNSVEAKTVDYLNSISNPSRVRLLKYTDEFNFSAINNFAAKQANGELLLFLNNDTEVISPDWLESMIEHAVRPEVGAVGARLLYPDRTLQHAGVIVGLGGVAGHAHLNLPHDDPGYFGRAKLVQNLSAVTGACLMTKATLFRSLNGFNEKDLAVAFNDVDYCLRVREIELLVVYTPYAELFHYESLSRGSDLDPDKIERFKREIKYMQDHWPAVIRYDPYYNPNLNLDLSFGSFSINVPINPIADEL